MVSLKIQRENQWNFFGRTLFQPEAHLAIASYSRFANLFWTLVWSSFSYQCMTLVLKGSAVQQGEVRESVRDFI